MGFWKTRTGTFEATDGTGRHFRWDIPNFAQYKAGDTLDSKNVTCFTKAKFHLHMDIGENGEVGLYMHYKKPPVPKYSYYFANSKGEVMRQHTAHTIPAKTERCGHWNVCGHRDMMDFLTDDNNLTVILSFDDDDLVVKRLPRENITSVMWTIPDLLRKNLSPYSSKGFFIDSTHIAVRLDIKRKSTTDLAPWDPADIQTLIFFLFSRKGTIPDHSIELLDATGKTYAKVEKDDGTTPTLAVEKSVLDRRLGAGGALFVKVNLFTGGNPLEALNLQSGGGSNDAVSEGSTRLQPRQVEVGEEKELYDVMDD